LDEYEQLTREDYVFLDKHQRKNGRYIKHLITDKTVDETHLVKNLERVEG
jgi:hypothetical protein